MKAVEVTGTVDEHRQLRLDAALPIQGPMRVRVLVLYPAQDEEIDEEAWLQAGTRNPAFDYLREPAEDIYSPTDGRPFDGQA